ncbi:MAG TPA: hypothetical protein VJI52_04895, partial [Candidatus Nanoarchaeia archaeon]|nr:hypothetical protein [Candidatus Nanoarchaeia archaeon]
CSERESKVDGCGSSACNDGACVDSTPNPTVPRGDMDYCVDHLCGAGEGDCDGDSQCRAGLTCVNNVGASYGFDSGVDVCEGDSGSDGGNSDSQPGDLDYCEVNGPCGEGEGDCDVDNECQSGLTCVSNVGDFYGYSPSTDVCEGDSGWDSGLPAGDMDYCVGTLCGEGEGDCDGDDECGGGLICVQNVGADYGFGSGVDVCESTDWGDGGADSLPVGDLDYCSESNQCFEGEGDCDNDFECRDGLICVQNVGADYGFSSGTDVCEDDGSDGGDTCNSQDSYACYSGDVYWYDSCGTRETKKLECGTSSCGNGACSGSGSGGGQTCTSNDHLVCYLGNSYWFNSCGNMGNLNQSCSNGCSNGTCTSGSSSDSDGDGFDNDGERLAGSNPNLRSSTPFTVLSNYSASDIFSSQDDFVARPASSGRVSAQSLSFLPYLPCGSLQGLASGLYNGGVDSITALANAGIFIALHWYTIDQIVPDLDDLFAGLSGLIQSDKEAIWRNYWKETLVDADNFMNNYSFLVSCDVSTESKEADFRNYYAVGKTSGYMIEIAAETIVTGGSLIAAVKNEMKAGTLASRAARGGKAIEAMEDAIVNLKRLGATDDMIGAAISQGANLENTRQIGKWGSTIAWLEENPYLHIYNKHGLSGGNYAKFSDAGISLDGIQPRIFETTKNPFKSLRNSTSQRWCLFSEVTSIYSKYKYVKVVLEENGYIVTAQPINTLTCTD